MKLQQVIHSPRAPPAPQPNLTESLNYLDHHHDDVDDDDDDDAHLMMVDGGRNGALSFLARHGMPTELDPIIWYHYDNDIYYDEVDDCKR